MIFQNTPMIDTPSRFVIICSVEAKIQVLGKSLLAVVNAHSLRRETI